MADRGDAEILEVVGCQIGQKLGIDVILIRAGFLDPESRSDLIDLARDGSVAHRLARRANALVLLDGGMSCGEVAKVLLLDDSPIGHPRRA